MYASHLLVLIIGKINILKIICLSSIILVDVKRVFSLKHFLIASVRAIIYKSHKLLSICLSISIFLSLSSSLVLAFHTEHISGAAGLPYKNQLTNSKIFPIIALVKFLLWSNFFQRSNFEPKNYEMKILFDRVKFCKKKKMKN